MKNHLLSMLFLSILLSYIGLTSCDKSGKSSDSIITYNSDPVTLELTEQIRIVFPVDSLSNNANVQLNETETPLLPTEFEALGQAYHINNTGILENLANIYLPIPAGESGTDLSIVRVSDSGLLTVLLTEIDDGWLKAKTDAFSTVLVMRVLPVNTSPIIGGPSILPVGEKGLYQELRFSENPSSALTLDWNVYGPAAIESNNGRDLLIKATDEGRIDISLNATNPETGYQGFSSFIVSAQTLLSEEQAANQGGVADQMVVLLNGGPSSVNFGESVSLIGKALNSSSNIISWHWKTGSETVHGDSCNGCENPFNFPSITYEKLGKHVFEVDAVDINGDESSASIKIMVLPISAGLAVTGPLKIDLTESSSATFDAVITEPEDIKQCEAYNFNWNIAPGTTQPNNLSNDGTDQIIAYFLSTGTYLLKLSVSCSGGAFSGTIIASYATQIEAKGRDIPLKLTINRFPISTGINKLVDIEVRIDGGIIVSAGIKGKYKIEVNWDDGAVENYEVTPNSSYQGGFANPQHIYKVSGDRTVTFKVTDAAGNITTKAMTIKVEGPDSNIHPDTLTMNFDIPGFNINFSPTIVTAAKTGGAEHILIIAAIENPQSTLNSQNFFGIQIDSRQINGAGTYTIGMVLEEIDPEVQAGQAAVLMRLNDITNTTDGSIVGFVSNSGTIAFTEFNAISGDRISGSYSANVLGERVTGIDEEDNEIIEIVTGSVNGEFSMIIQ